MSHWLPSFPWIAHSTPCRSSLSYSGLENASSGRVSLAGRIKLQPPKPRRNAIAAPDVLKLNLTLPRHHPFERRIHLRATTIMGQAATDTRSRESHPILHMAATPCSKSTGSSMIHGWTLNNIMDRILGINRMACYHCRLEKK